MNNEVIPGFGRKRPQINKPASLLFLDKDNPRLPKEVQGKAESELLKVLHEEFNLDEPAESMAQNGYFDEEPLVAIPGEIPKGFALVVPIGNWCRYIHWSCRSVPAFFFTLRCQRT